VEVVELDEGSRRALARRHPEVMGYGSAFVVVATPEVQRRVTDALRAVATAANDSERIQVDRLIEALSPPIDVPSPRVIERAREETVQRVRILRDFGAFTAQQIAERRSSPAKRSRVVYRWRRESRIFSVTYRGVPLYLGFQFDDDGQPLPVVQQVLELIGAWDEWDIALWFVRSNPTLDRHAPVELLTREAERVVRAAARDAGAPEHQITVNGASRAD
jgi:hypothetical protein